MSKVTSKLQITVPKALAIRYGITPGDSIQFVPAGDSIRLVTGRSAGPAVSVAERLQSFDRATARERRRHTDAVKAKGSSRGWTREELYDRPRSR